MIIKKLLLFILLLLTFSLPALAEVADKDLKIQGIENDKFSREITIKGSVDYKNPFGGTFRSWFIRSFYNKQTHIASHQLYVDISYFGSWAFYEYADDEDAKSLKLTSISKNLENCSGLCSFSETVIVDLDEATLMSKMKNGYEIKLSAKDGDSFVLKVSSEQIRAQMLAISNNFAAPNQLSVGELEKLVAEAPANSIPSKVKLGVMFVDLPPAAATILKREGFKAVTIYNVTQGSVAEKAGLKLGDMLYEYDGKPIQSKFDLQNAVAATQVGSKIPIKVLRGKEGAEYSMEAQF